MTDNDYNKNLFSKEDTLIAKSFAIILMFYHHLFAFPDRIAGYENIIQFGNVYGITWAEFLGNVGNICVAIFMFLSGYATYIQYNKNKDIINEVIFSKLKNFYLIFLKVFIVFIPLGCLLGKAPFAGKDSKEAFRELVGTLSGFSISNNYNAEWWFITPFIIVLIMFPVIVKILDNKKISFYTQLLIIAFLSYSSTLYKNITSLAIFDEFNTTVFHWLIIHFFSHVSKFLMGSFFAKYMVFEKIRDKIHHKIFYIIAIVFVLCHRFCIGERLDYLLAGIFIISITTCLKDIPYVSKLFINLGKKSTYMWLLHSFFCYKYFTRIVLIPRYSFLIVIWLIFLTFFTGILIEKLFSLKFFSNFKF